MMLLIRSVGREFLRGPSGGWVPVAEGNRAGDGMARIVSEEKATGTLTFIQPK